MKRRTVFMLVTGLMLTIWQGAEAAEPPYLLLRVQATPIPPPTSHAHGYTVHNGPAAQPYAYGWFGVAPRQHWSRHFGYYRNYTQWSGK